jgi:hypothetical protein
LLCASPLPSPPHLHVLLFQPGLEGWFFGDDAGSGVRGMLPLTIPPIIAHRAHTHHPPHHTGKPHVASSFRFQAHVQRYATCGQVPVDVGAEKDGAARVPSALLANAKEFPHAPPQVFVARLDMQHTRARIVSEVTAYRSTQLLVRQRC